MPKSQMQKTKLIVLSEYFKKYTDEEHGVSVEDIISYMNSNGISCERKSVYSDIEALQSIGYDIVKEKSERKTVYFLANRDFETAEIKMFADIIQSSRFITPKKSEELIGKIQSLCSVHEAKLMSRQVLITGRAKAVNETIYINIDKIHTCLNSSSAISFKYFYYNHEKKKCYRKESYEAVPLALIWNNDNYYLAAFDRVEKKKKHYRVDRMEKVEMAGVRSEEEEKIFREFDSTKYSKRVFDMLSGEEERVRLSFPERFVGAMFDRFGLDIAITKEKNERYSMSVSLELSPAFFAWLSTFEGEVMISEPESARHAYLEHIEKIRKQYCEAQK